MYQSKLVIRGAQQHNVKNIDLTLPRYKLVGITGVSGSGKSSLAFDTLYAEGQRPLCWCLGRSVLKIYLAITGRSVLFSYGSLHFLQHTWQHSSWQRHTPHRCSLQPHSFLVLCEKPMKVNERR